MTIRIKSLASHDQAPISPPPTAFPLESDPAKPPKAVSLFFIVIVPSAIPVKVVDGCDA